MIDKKLRVIIRHMEEFDGAGLWILERRGNEVYVARSTELSFYKQENGYALPEPTLAFATGYGTEFLTSLSNALVEIGFRPDELKATNREIAAIQSHLEDMRKLAFGKILPSVVITDKGVKRL
jgi:hypothetical protein